MAAAAYTLSSSEDSEGDFSVEPDLATRLKARLEVRPTSTPGLHQTTTEPTRTSSFDISKDSNSKGVTEEIEIISSDEEEEGTDNNGNEDEVTFVSEVKSPAVVGGGRAKRPRVAGYDSTTEEEDLPDVLPISPINCVADDNETSSDFDSLPCDVEQQQASLGQRRPFANGHYQPALTDQVFGRAAVQSSRLAPSQSISSPSPPPLSKADAKKRDVERRKQERERLKRDRLQEKERAKEMKELEKVAKKANSLAECTKWVAVRASGRLCASPAGSQLAGTVSGSDLQWRLQADSIVEEAVTFARVDPRSKQETPESLAIVILDSEPFMRLIRNQQYPSNNHISNCTSTNSHQSVGYTLSGRAVVETSLARTEGFRYNCTLEEQCKTWKELLGVEILSLFVWGLDEHFKKKNYSKTGVRGWKSKGNDQAEPNRLDVETALTTLQIMQRVDHRLFSNAIQLAEYVVHLARAVAQAPYKRELLDDGAMFSSWYAEGSNVAPVKVTPSGVGLLKLWQQQLRQFISVGLETAQAIADAYPSPKLLLEAYEGLSPDEGSRLLADIPVRRGAGPLQTTRRLGPELSKKVHTFFTSSNPDRVLGS